MVAEKGSRRMGAAGQRGRALPMLWLLLAAVIALPVAALGIGGYYIWQGVAEEAERDLQRRADIGAENASRVFETQALVLRAVSRMTQGLSDAEIKAREGELHREMAALIAAVPQIWDVFIWAADGQALASARLYPVPPGNAAHRDYFRALEGGVAEPYISAVLVGRLDGARFFNVTQRRRGPTPAFAGAIGVSIDPSYFERRWVETALAGTASGTSMALVRFDGQILARAPDLQQPAKLPSTRFLATLSREPESGRYRDISVVDGLPREFLFRRVPSLPLYVTSSISDGALRIAFLHAMTPHLWFGIPAVVLLVCLVILVIRRTVDSERATARADAERAARDHAERVLAHAAKLESIGRLAAGLAHDFNNILAAAIGGIDLSLRRLRSGRMAEVEPLLGHALQAARRGAGLTKQLLTFARGSEAPGDTVQVAEVIKEVAALLPPLVGPSVAIRTEVENDVWPVQSSRPLLESALMNLVVNAKDAMSDGGVITIRAANVPRGAPLPEGLRRDGEWVRVAVSDTGPGFPDEVRTRAFEPFVTTKDIGRGTGLGLSQVYGSARQAGGTACIEGEGSGATVALYLPRGTPPTPTDSAPAANLGSDNPLRILLVDDDHLVRATSALALRDAGHEVLEAESPAAALNTLASGQEIDVLVADYAMPAMNGASLIGAARQMRPSLPALMVSGQANFYGIDLPPDVARLPKPFTPDDLARAGAASSASQASRPARDEDALSAAAP
jgi:two-component system NtrC family sensor kinase